jgi:hypothetical protein
MVQPQLRSEVGHLENGHQRAATCTDNGRRRPWFGADGYPKELIADRASITVNTVQVTHMVQNTVGFPKMFIDVSLALGLYHIVFLNGVKKLAFKR